MVSIGIGPTPATLRNVTTPHPQTLLDAIAMSAFVTKGTRVRVSYLQAAELGTYSIAGAQMKVAAQTIEYDGVVTHVWGYGTPENVTRRTIVVMRDSEPGTLPAELERELPESSIVGVLPFDRDPPGLETYEAPDGWWVLSHVPGRPDVTALLQRFSSAPTMVPAYPAGHEADGWSTFPSKVDACKAAWLYYALTATTMHS